MSLRSELEPITVQTTSGASLAFRRYLFEAQGQPLHVFFSVAEATRAGSYAGIQRTSHWDRLKAALSGSRNYGLRTLEVLVTGIADPAEAQAALLRRLDQMIKTDSLSSSSLSAGRLRNSFESMIRVGGIYESGKVTLDTLVDWRNGTHVEVEPNGPLPDDVDTCIDGSRWEDDPAAVQRWLGWFDNLQAVFGPEEQENFARALREVREQQAGLRPAWERKISRLSQ